MDLTEVLNGGYHVGLVVAIIVLWRQLNNIQQKLDDCLMGHGDSSVDLTTGKPGL